MSFDEGHIYNVKGELEGLFTVDGKEARRVFGNKRFWEGVTEVISKYSEINPSEMKYAQLENQATRVDNINKFGSNESGSFRHVLNIPYGLYLALIDYEPRLFRDKKTRTEFMKRYPQLRTCEQV